MKNVQVTVTGRSPLLMNRFPLEPVPGLAKMTKEEQAEHGAYRDADGKLHVPGTNMQRCLVGGGGYCKGKGRAMLTKMLWE